MDGDSSLADAVTRLFHLVDGLDLGIDVPGLATAREHQDRVRQTLTGYVLPRLADADRPLVVVIGGPTGAGKSTLTNSLVGSAASPSGVLRPTTRLPVMVYHPDDADALTALGLLAARKSAPGPTGAAAKVKGSAKAQPAAVRSASSEQPAEAPKEAAVPAPRAQVRAMPDKTFTPGLVIIDSPDLDSRVDGNRELAADLLAVADLWLFVTTGTDYADALAWGLITEAAERRVKVAAVINRLREQEMAAVRRHFAVMLTEAGLADAAMFHVPEVVLVDGLLPYPYVSVLRRWLDEQSGPGEERASLQASVLAGTLGQATAATEQLADAVAEHVAATRRHRVDLETIFSQVREEVQQRCGDASLVGDGLVRAWRSQTDGAVAAAGGFMRRWRAAGGDGETGYPAIGAALRRTLTELLQEQVQQAQFRVAERWAQHSAVTLQAELTAPAADLPARVDEAVTTWLKQLGEQSAANRAGEAAVQTDALARATLALAVPSTAPRGGRPVSERVGRDGDLPGELRSLIAQHLTEAGRPLPTLPELREAWFELIRVLYGVISHDEARLTELLGAADLTPRVAMDLRAAARAVAEHHAPDQGRS